jgi:hypothetical protein
MNIMCCLDRSQVRSSGTPKETLRIKTFVNCKRVKQRKKEDVNGNRRNFIVKNRVIQLDKTKKFKKRGRE